MKYYLIEVWGCVEAGILGKFKTRKARDEAAQKHHTSPDYNPDEDVLFWGNVDKKGNLTVGSYQAGFFDDDECDKCGLPMSEHDDGECPRRIRED